MSKSRSIIWNIYFAIYLALVTTNAVYFFSSKNQIFWYYQVLLAFDIWFLVPYFLNALSITFNVLTLVPLHGFITRKSFLSPRFWRYFFILRLILEFFGKSFEAKMIQAFFYESPATAWASIGMLVSLLLPSYIALYFYAFKCEQSAAKQKYHVCPD